MISLIVCLTFPLLSQNAIEWMTFDEVIEAQKKEKKKIFVDMYTDWCGWCKRMDATTFKDKKVVKIINENYYPVKFNAEVDKEIEFKGEKYKLIRRGKKKYHELAVEFIKKSSRPSLSYPTFIFIDENLEIIQPIKGYKKADQMVPILKYFAGDHHKKQSWNEYKNSFSNN